METQGTDTPPPRAANAMAKSGQTEIVFSLSDFKEAKEGGTRVLSDWNRIASLSLDIIQNGGHLRLQNNPILRSLVWTDASPR